MARKHRVAKQSGLATAAVLSVVIAALYIAQEVLIPIVMSVLLAFLLATPVTWLERRRVGRVASVLVVVTVTFAVIGSLGYVVGQQMVALAGNLDDYQAEIQRKVRRVSGAGSNVGNVLEKLSGDFSKARVSPASQPTTGPGDTSAASGGAVGDAARDISADPSGALARESLGGAPSTAPSVVGTTPANPLYTVSQGQPVSPVQTLLTYLAVVAGPVGTAGLVIVIVIFILLEREALRDRFIAVISRGNYTVTTRAINDATTRISRYLVAQSIVNGSYGLTIGIGLFLVSLFFGNGVWFPSFVLWGMLCAVLRFIPYVGPAVSSLFPIALALAVYPGFTVAIAVLILFVVVELLSNNVIEPWLYGASTGLSTVAILVAAIFWTWMWGSVGLLVATPLTVCLAVLGKHVASLRVLYVLLGDEDALPPAVAFYQRLLAGERIDAEGVVQRVILKQGPTLVPDIVYLPALRMARRDHANLELTSDQERRIFDDTLAIAQPPTKNVDGVVPADEPAAGRPLVLACPAHHRADEVTLHVLAHALEPLGLRTTVMSTRSLPVDVEATVARESPMFVVIGVMPPGGLPQTRYLCRRLRKRFPDLHIFVGIWGRVRDFDKLLVGLREAGASYVTTSVEQTGGQISTMLVQAPAREPSPSSNPL